jgi:hypothetical protein
MKSKKVETGKQYMKLGEMRNVHISILRLEGKR